MSNDSRAVSVPIELLRKYDRAGPRYTSYPTVPAWDNKVSSESYVDILKKTSKKSAESWALYCHIPFCVKRCYFCGCNTFISRGGARVDEYNDMLIKEIQMVSDLLDRRKMVRELHFGGGTPTFLDVSALGRILDRFDRQFDFSSDCERSIEIDPRVTTPEQLEYLAGRGFNRISLGVQDFDPDVQKAAGRNQSKEITVTTLEHCRRLGYAGINLDLIYGLPLQTVESFASTIDQVIALRPDRLAVYSFAYLPSMKAHQARIDAANLPSTEVKYQLFATAVEKFTAAGYFQIGMDHFALPEDKLARARADGRLHRNFMGYTVRSASEMIGLGMSSIGYVENSFYQSQAMLGAYMDSIREGRFAIKGGMALSHDDLIRQHVISTLMCNFRLDYAALEGKYGISYEEYFSKEHGRLGEFFDDELLVETDGRLEITPVGRAFVRNIAMTYDAYLDDKSRKPVFSRTI